MLREMSEISKVKGEILVALDKRKRTSGENTQQVAIKEKLKVKEKGEGVRETEEGKKQGGS